VRRYSTWGGRALAFYEKQDKASLSDDALAQRSKALTLMGEIATQRGDLDGAMRRYLEAMSGTAEALRRFPNDPQRLYDHAQNVFYVGDVAWKRGQTGRAEAAMREYKGLAERMIKLDPDNPKWQLERKYANSGLGVILIDLGRYGEAVTIFQESLAEAERLLDKSPDNADYRKSLIETLAWLADGLEYSGQLDDALAQRERQIALLDNLIRDPKSDSDYRRQAMAAHRAAGRLFAIRGDLAGGLAHAKAAVQLGEALNRIEPDNAEWTGLAAFAYLDQGELELASGDVGAAGVSVGTGCEGSSRLIERDSSVTEWRFGLPSACLRLRERLALAQGANDQALLLAGQLVALARKEAVGKQSADTRFAVANAELLRGLAASAAGNRATASVAFRAAAAVWPEGVALRPSLAAQQVLILQGLGRSDKANALAAKLAAMGYRHPTYLRDRRMLKQRVG
jgi:tetratricopeptide (TPR) repeat protein